jgi:sugar phosphate isomerase/epimerase
MSYSRREFGRLALAGVPAAMVMRGEGVLGAWLQARPNSLIEGVQIGAITYSYRSLPDQSAEATLKYVVDSGISAIELMGGPVNDWARKKGNFKPSVVPEGRGGRGGFPGAGGGRGGAPAPSFAPVANMKTGWGNDQPAGQWNGTPCPAPSEGRGGGPGGGGGGRGRGQTPEQIAAAEEERKWRLGLSMDVFKELRKMYNDAGVTIYAVKDVREQTDEDLEYTFAVARALGASHVTLELPAGAEAATRLKRLGDTAMKHKMFAAYHTHQQGSMTAFDEAFAISKGNMANVDLGHFVAATDPGGSPMDFLNKHAARIASVHVKDRTTMAHCALTVPWGTGEAPLKEILQLMRKNKWKFPASIELEYNVPEGSDAVKEVRNCVEYCRKVLTART